MPALPSPPDDALSVWRRLHEAGHVAYFCGGCVRDAVLGRPVKDWDIATDATPETVEALFPKTVAVGKAFGVMVVVGEEDNYEVATFRADGGYSDGRRPDDVRFGDAKEDVLRRDFTINALLYDPERSSILDYVGGLDDLAARVLRTVGDAETRFREDHLRLLRAVRFAARTGFALDPETRRAMDELAGLVRTVSAERVGEELRRMLTDGGARQALELMEQTHLLLHVLPEVAAMRGMPQPKAFHPEGDVLTHTAIMLEMMEAGSPDWRPADALEKETLAFAVLLHDVGKPATVFVRDRIRFHEHDSRGAALAEEILLRLKRPRKVIDAVRDMIGRHIHFANLPRMRVAKLRRWLQEPLFPLHLELHRLDCASSHRQMDNYDFGLQSWREECDRPEPVAPILTGKDLIALGYAPGPHFGDLLDEVQDLFLEGTLTDADAARAWVQENHPPGGA